MKVRDTLLPVLEERLIKALEKPPAIIFFLLIVLIAYAGKPTSFSFAWNEGRSGLLFVVPLAAIEMGRSFAKPLARPSGSKFAYAVIAAGAAYYSIASLASFTQPLIQWAEAQGVDRLIAEFSWIATIDYAASSALLIALTYLLDEPKPVTPALYLAGMTSFLFVDTVLPYNSLGPFQAVVPPMLQVVAFLVNATGLGQASVQNNILSLSKGSVFLNLAVYWPSAGLHGIIISFLAVAAISVKLRTGWGAGTAYTLIGVLGSVIVNLLRIALLALYALGGGADPRAFERFHSVIGELLFLPWIAGYIYLLIRHENSKRLAGIAFQSSSSN